MSKFDPTQGVLNLANQNSPKPQPKPSGGGQGGGGGGATLDPTQRNVFDLMRETLAQWGLSSLAKDLRHLIVGGQTDPSELALALSQTDAYKQRFAANALRVKAGLRELQPAEYIALEEQYRNVMRQYGIPAGFYDDNSKLDRFIAGDVSPAEMQNRVQAAADLVFNSPPEAQKAWDQFYGGGKGGAIAAILDPKTAAPLVEQQVAASQIAGSALSQGLQANKGTAERLASEGVTLDQARAAYSAIAQRLQTDTQVGARFGMNLNQSDEEKATFEGDATALRKQNVLYSEEAGLFGGHGGATAATGNPGANY